MVDDFCLLTRFLNQLGGSPTAGPTQPARMSSKAEIRAFFRGEGTKVSVEGNGHG
jgi:hypothetical protein